LPAAGKRDCGLFVQMHYPMDADKEAFADQDFPSWRDEVIERLSATGGIPACLGYGILGGEETLAPPGAPLSSTDGGWPVVVFSAGLFGALELYQQFCIDVASTGAIVIALEHEDGAGMFARDCNDNIIEYTDPPVDATQIHEKIIEWRRPQMDARLVEYNATMEALTTMIKSTSENPEALEAVLRTGSVDRIVMSGHSFGAASAFYYLQYLASLSIPSPFLGSILMDQWMGPTSEAEDTADAVREPTVHITSNNWEGIPRIQKVIDRNPTMILSAAQTIGTVHQWISETQLLLPESVLKSMGAMGPGDWHTVFAATMQAVKLSKEAFLKPELRAGLNASIMELEPEHLKPFDLSVFKNVSL